jgi:hypothetical protein
VTCPGSGSHGQAFTPHTFLDTSTASLRQVPPDGVIEGTEANDEQSGGFRHVTYSWRLVPQP